MEIPLCPTCITDDENIGHRRGFAFECHGVYLPHFLSPSVPAASATTSVPALVSSSTVCGKMLQHDEFDMKAPDTPHACELAPHCSSDGMHLGKVQEQTVLVIGNMAAIPGSLLRRCETSKYCQSHYKAHANLLQCEGIEKCCTAFWPPTLLYGVGLVQVYGHITALRIIHCMS